VDDLQKVFEGWLRSRVAGERPGVAPGSVTEGGYDTDVEGMRSWRSDISEFALWLSANEPEMFGEFRYRYMGLDPEGWKAIVGFAGGFHDKPAGPPDESQLESDVEALVDNPVGEDVPAPTVTTPAPTTTTTTPPPTTTKPPRTIPVTPDTGPEVTAPPTTTVPPPTTTRPEHPSSIWPKVPPIQHAPFPLPGRGDKAGVREPDPLVEGRATALGEDFERPQRLRQRPITGLPMQEGRPGDWPWPGGSAGRAIVANLELSENGKFLAVVMNDLFDWMKSGWLRPGRQPLVPS